MKFQHEILSGRVPGLYPTRCTPKVQISELYIKTGTLTQAKMTDHETDHILVLKVAPYSFCIYALFHTVII